MTIRDQILSILSSNSIDYEHFHHEQAQTCIDASKNRGVDLSIGVKSLLFKTVNEFVIVSLRANLEVDSTKVRKFLKSNKLRFATSDELLSKTYVVKGALPPLVSKLYKIPHYIDNSVLTGEKIAFNIGVLNESVMISTKQFQTISDAIVCDIAK